MQSDIMTIDEVADYLKLKVKTAYHLAAKGDIPGFKVGGAWRFRRRDIEAWIHHQTNKDEPENEDPTKKKYKPTL
jgi:excisionase family DNA binding protein